MATVENFPGRLPAANSSERAYRSPPLNVEAEQALLGAILVNNDAFDRVSDFLKPEHFVEEIHRRIYEIAGSLIRAGKVATPITLKTFLGEHDLGGVTVQQYLARLAADATTIINAFDYGRTIHDLAVRRELIQIGEDVVNVAYDAPVDSSPRDQIEEAERRLYAVAEGGRYDGGFQRFSDALKIAVDMAAKAYERDGSLSGVATGLTDLDRYMGGLQASDLVILAGRPGMGKTALATNIAFNIAKAYRGETRPDGTTAAVDGGRVGFFSLEMSAEQLATRIIAEQSGVPSYKIRRGDITENDFQQVAEAVREMQAIPFYIDQTGGISIAQLTARARRLKRQRGLDLLVVDYLQLLAGSRTGRNDNRVQELTEITTGLKALAKELNVPILALSQLSRQVEQRDDKRPQLSDLRESGSIEQDADVVLFVFREEYYLKNREPRPGTEEHVAWMNEMERAHGTRRGHHRQAAPRPDRHGRAAVRGRADPLRQSRPRRGAAGDPLSVARPSALGEPGQAGEGGDDREAGADHQRDRLGARRRDAEEQRDQRRAGGEAGHPRGRQHAARRPGAPARRRRQQRAVVRRLEEAEARAAQRHRPGDVDEAGVERQARQQHHADRQPGEPDEAEDRRRHAIRQPAGDRRGNADRHRPRRHQQPGLDLAAAEFELEIERHRHQSERLGGERADRGRHRQREDRDAHQVDRDQRRVELRLAPDQGGEREERRDDFGERQRHRPLAVGHRVGADEEQAEGERVERRADEVERPAAAVRMRQRAIADDEVDDSERRVDREQPLPRPDGEDRRRDARPDRRRRPRRRRR